MYKFENLVDTEKLYRMMNNAETTLPSRNEKIRCVYFLFGKSDTILYVGRTKNIASRYWEHHYGKGRSVAFYKEISHFSYIPVNDDSMATFLEGAFIKLLSPKHNSETKGRIKPKNRRYSDEQVIEMKKRLMGGERQLDVKNDFNITYSFLQNIMNGLAYSDVYVEGFEQWHKQHMKGKVFFTEEIVETIYNLYFKEKVKQKNIAEKYGVVRSRISKIVTGVSYPKLFSDYKRKFPELFA